MRGPVSDGRVSRSSARTRARGYDTRFAERQPQILRLRSSQKNAANSAQDDKLLCGDLRNTTLADADEFAALRALPVVAFYVVVQNLLERGDDSVAA